MTVSPGTLPPVFALRSHTGKYLQTSPFSRTSLSEFRSPLFTKCDNNNRQILHYHHGPVIVKDKQHDQEFSLEVVLQEGHDRCLLKCVDLGAMSSEDKFVGADVYNELLVGEEDSVMEAFHVHAIVAVESVVISAQSILSKRYDIAYEEEKGVTYQPAGDAQPFDARLDSISESLAQIHIDVAKQKLDFGILFGIAYPGPLDPKTQTPTSPPYAKTPIPTLLSLLHDSTHSVPYSIAQARAHLTKNPTVRLPLLSFSMHLTSLTLALITEDKKFAILPSPEESEKKEEDSPGGKLPLLPLHDPVGFGKRLHEYVKGLVEEHKVRTVLVGGEYTPLEGYGSWSGRFGEFGKRVECVVASGED
ncbi:hypothetical protein HK097_005887, partial [Rhizophlyctis rosea]